MIVPSNLDEMIPASCNTEDGTILANIRSACARSLPWLQVSEPVFGTALIVGGGPSVRPFLPVIKQRQQAGDKVVAMNGTLGLLADGGIDADYFVLLDARLESVQFLERGKSLQYLIASQCHPTAFDAVGGKDVVLWHPHYEGVQEIIGDRECALIGGGTTVGLQAMSIMFAKGFRNIDLYGFDSSYLSGAGHAYQQALNDRDQTSEYMVNGKSFIAASWMARQAMEFQTAAAQLAEADCTVVVHGSGLLPEIARLMAAAPSEPDKYRQMWSNDLYRHVSPGQAVVPTFLDLTQGETSPKVVDFGCGTGRGGQEIRRQTGWDVLLLDFAENCLDAGIELPFETADLTQPGDIGFCTDVLEHIPPENVEAVVRNILAATPKAFFQISTVPDHLGALIGQHLHLTVKPFEWWEALFFRLGCRILWGQEQEGAALFYVQRTA